MQSFHSDTKLKSAMVKEIEKHRKADSIIQGTYGKQNGKWSGCAVACSLRSLAIIQGKTLVKSYNNHKDYETELGIPEWLARLEDTIFENLPVEQAKKWPTQFIKSIPVGVNLESIKSKFCAFILKENIDRVLTLDISDDLKKQVVASIRGVLSVHEEAIRTGKWDESAAESARAAARAAAESAESAESAAWAAAESAESAAESAESAAWAAAESAAESARAAAESAESAAWAAAESAAWAAVFQKYSKELLKLLKSAK